MWKNTLDFQRNLIQNCRLTGWINSRSNKRALFWNGTMWMCAGEWSRGGGVGGFGGKLACKMAHSHSKNDISNDNARRMSFGPFMAVEQCSLSFWPRYILNLLNWNQRNANDKTGVRTKAHFIHFLVRVDSDDMTKPTICFFFQFRQGQTRKRPAMTPTGFSSSLVLPLFHSSNIFSISFLYYQSLFLSDK